MRAERFDALARRLGRAGSRRRFLRALLGGGLLAAGRPVSAQDAGNRPVVLARPAAPTITGGPTVVNLTETAATIVWTTDQAADSVVTYGTSTRLGQAAVDATRRRDHRLTLSGLKPATTYHYQVRSKNAAGLEVATTRDLTFRTRSPVSGHLRVDVHLCNPTRPLRFFAYPPDSHVGGDDCTYGTVPLTITDASGTARTYEASGGLTKNRLDVTLPAGHYTLREDLTGKTFAFDLTAKGLYIVVQLPACPACTLGGACPTGNLLCVVDSNCCSGDACVHHRCVPKTSNPP